MEPNVKYPYGLNLQLVERTHFRKRRAESGAWLWFWTKEHPSGAIITAGDHGLPYNYTSFNDFFTAEGHPGCTINACPENYVVQKFSEDHWTITKYEVIQENIDN